MKHVKGSDPRTFNCSSNEVETITIKFTPMPDDCLGEIRFCFGDDCNEADQKVVDGDELSFKVNTDKKRIRLFYFFIPPAEGDPLGKCKTSLSSSNGDVFSDPRFVKEDPSGIPFSENEYVFERV